MGDSFIELRERIAWGRVKIADAKATGKDVTAWEHLLARLEEQARYTIDWLLPDGRLVSGAYLVKQWERLGKPAIQTPRATVYLLPQWLDGSTDSDFLDKLTAVIDWLQLRCRR